jgi:hypothetical protein
MSGRSGLVSISFSLSFSSTGEVGGLVTSFSSLEQAVIARAYVTMIPIPNIFFIIDPPYFG